MIENLTLAKEVQAAIKAGARTQREIAGKTKLSHDQIGDALAYLLLTVRTIRTEIRRGARVYLPASSQRGPLDAPLSFSTLRGLMPRALSFRH